MARQAPDIREIIAAAEQIGRQRDQLLVALRAEQGHVRVAVAKLARAHRREAELLKMLGASIPHETPAPALVRMLPVPDRGA